MRVVFTILLLILGFGVHAQQVEIQLDGAIAFDQSVFTIQNAGSDFSSSIESESSLFVTIASNDDLGKKTNPNQGWKVEVRKEDLSWDNSIQLEIVRTGDGIKEHSSGRVYNGGSYQTVQEISGYFFNGRGFFTDIPVQVRLSGLSIVNGANDYETNVVLTIYDD